MMTTMAKITKPEHRKRDVNLQVDEARGGAAVGDEGAEGVGECCAEFGVESWKSMAVGPCPAGSTRCSITPGARHDPAPHQQRRLSF